MAQTYEVSALAKLSASSAFEKIRVLRNAAGDDDVEFDVKFCGVCHTDVHVAQGEWGAAKYPCVPGHELAGICTRVGNNVKDIEPGQKVGAGYLIDACLECRNCRNKQENYCEKGFTTAANSTITHGHIHTNFGYTVGGYANSITVNRRFVFTIPEDYPLEKAGPIFCAGISTFAPLSRWGAKKGGMSVGVMGIGGLGLMAIKQAKAMGNEVTAISTSPKKEAMAKRIGADKFVVSSNEESMKVAHNTLDLIIDTVSANHQAETYLPLLRSNGVLNFLGVSSDPHSISGLDLIMRGKTVTGSAIGGMDQAQECMDFCHKHDIFCEVELFTAERLPEVYKKLSTKNDSGVRYVMDVVNSLK